VKLEVHLCEGLVDVLDVLGAVAQEHRPLAEEAPQEGDVSGGAEGAVEQAEGVELLDPLAIEDVGLAAGDVLHAAGVDETDLEAPIFEDLDEGDPVDAGGLHGDGGDPASSEPVGEGVEVGGEGVELPHVLAFGVGAWGNCGEVGMGADIDAGGVGVELREGRRLTHGLHLPIVR
jgi:hypothetical protein